VGRAKGLLVVIWDNYHCDKAWA